MVMVSGLRFPDSWILFLDSFNPIEK